MEGLLNSEFCQFLRPSSTKQCDQNVSRSVKRHVVLAGFELTPDSELSFSFKFHLQALKQNFIFRVFVLVVYLGIHALRHGIALESRKRVDSGKKKIE